MFQADEIFKSHVLAKLSPNSTLHFLLLRYWDQAMLYLLLAPFQWLHFTHMLYTTQWNEFNLFGKILMMLYAFSLFAFYEVARILVYHLCRGVSSGEDMKKAASRIVSYASQLSKKGCEHAAPMMVKLSQSAQDMFHQTMQTASQLITTSRQQMEQATKQPVQNPQPAS